MNIITIIGARPQFIKAAVVSRALLQYSSIKEKILHTGQHYDANMSEVFFRELDIPAPHINLGVGGGTHGENTGRMLELIEKILLSENPSLVLVYGDTDSTVAGALAAAKLHIPVAHIEAGLRSFNKKMPEELNRIVTDHLADYLFTPGLTAVNNLKREGIAEERIIDVGDVMYDAALFYRKKAVLSSPALLELSLHPKQYILATIHRAENADDPVKLQAIIAGLQTSSLPVVWPIHPRTKQQVQQFHIDIPGNVLLVNPVGYLEMSWLEQNAAVIATDSGGVQKEAYFSGVPCITLRNETEWTELVDCGANILSGSASAGIAEALKHASSIDPAAFNPRFYGNGNAGERIAACIKNL